ncbi:hypothetical protein B0H14DRAFT_3605778 [Mycena olivaceomarginata]|nr:hypothetical protein B0H14DRAFT_3605778 [Mycena olivaceomarginata]
MRAEEEARRAAVAEEGGTTAASTSQRSPAPSEMEGVELQNPFSSVLSTAASSGVLHLVGQQDTLSTSTQTQDFDKEMDDPPRSWTPDEDDKWGMGPPIYAGLDVRARFTSSVPRIHFPQPRTTLSLRRPTCTPRAPGSTRALSPTRRSPPASPTPVARCPADSLWHTTAPPPLLHLLPVVPSPHALLGLQSPAWLRIAPLCPALHCGPAPFPQPHLCALRAVTPHLVSSPPCYTPCSPPLRPTTRVFPHDHATAPAAVLACCVPPSASASPLAHNRLLVVTPFPSCDHAVHLFPFCVPSVVSSRPLPRPTSPQCSPISQPHRQPHHPPPYPRSCSLPAVLHLLRLFRVCPLAEDGAGARQCCSGRGVQAGRARCVGVRVRRSELGGADVWRVYV